MNSLVRVGCLCSIMFMLGSNLVLPLFNKDDTALAEETIQPFDYVDYGNEHTFGNSVIQSINWSFFKNWIKDNFYFRFQQMQGENWINRMDLFELEKTWNEEGYWKLSFNFDTDLDTNYRIVLATNISNTEFIDRNYWEFFINYSFNENEQYSIMMNFSDLQGLGCSFDKGLYNGYAYWTCTRFCNGGKHFELDPTFGYKTTDGSTTIYYSTSGSEYLRGVYAAATGGNGVLDNITVYFGTVGQTIDVQCALYEYVDYSSSYAGERIAVSETKEILTSHSDSLIAFNFSGTVNIVNNTNYYLCVRPAQDYSAGSSVWLKRSGISGYAIYIYDSSGVTFDDPMTGESTTTNRIYMYASYTTGGSGLTDYLIDTYTCDFGNETSDIHLVDTFTCDFGNETSDIHLIDTYTCDFGSDSSDIHLVDTYSCDWGNDSSDIHLIGTFTTDFGNDTGNYTFNVTQLEAYLQSQGYIKESDDVNIGMDAGILIILTVGMFFWFAENKKDYILYVLSGIFASVGGFFYLGTEVYSITSFYTWAGIIFMLFGVYCFFLSFYYGLNHGARKQ